MKRRHFLRATSVAGLSVPALLSSVHAAGGKTKLARSAKQLDLTEVTITELQQKMQSGALTSEAIVEWYLQRIEDIDRKGPQLNAVIEVNPDAKAIARQMDEERKAGKVRGPLHGIAIMVKDNIDTADKMMTTAGSLALAGNIAKQDAFIVKQLRQAGAIIIGKTNLSEFANFRSTQSTSGWSSRGGQTKMPYVLTRNPSGSSSGSGAATAASLCTVAVGTETDGSVVSPAAVSGLVGIKPTVGLCSRSGIIPISATQDTAGPMARTVTDAAVLLSAMAGVDGADAVTLKSKTKAKKDYTQCLESAALKGKRLGLEKSFLKGTPAVVALLKDTINVLKSQGAVVVEVDLLKPIYTLGDAEFDVLKYEFKDGLNKYLKQANARVKSLTDIIKFNKQHEIETMPYFKQEILEACEKLGGLDTPAYKAALAKSISARKIITDMMTQYKLDAFCGTTNGPACCIDLVNGDYNTGFSFSTPAAMAGYPHITVPMGFVHDLPMGFSFFSTAYKEPEILAMAYAFEQATKARKQPGFLAG